MRFSPLFGILLISCFVCAANVEAAAVDGGEDYFPGSLYAKVIGNNVRITASAEKAYQIDIYLASATTAGSKMSFEVVETCYSSPCVYSDALPDGVNYYYAKALYISSHKMLTIGEEPKKDTTPPLVIENRAEVDKTKATITITAKDDSGIGKIAISVKGPGAKGTAGYDEYGYVCKSSPCVFSRAYSDGVYSYSAEVSDAVSPKANTLAVAEKKFKVYANRQYADKVIPEVFLKASAEGKNVKIIATADDGDDDVRTSGIAGVWIYVSQQYSLGYGNYREVAYCPSSPCEYSGSFRYADRIRYKAEAVDAKGNRGYSSIGELSLISVPTSNPVPTPSSLPDYTVTISPPLKCFAGESAKYTYTVKNSGPVDSKQIVHMIMEVNGVKSDYYAVPPLKSQESTKTADFTFEFTPKSGSNTIKVTADARGELAESNEGNNAMSQAFTCFASSDSGSGASDDALPDKPSTKTGDTVKKTVPSTKPVEPPTTLALPDYTVTISPPLKCFVGVSAKFSLTIKNNGASTQTGTYALSEVNGKTEYLPVGGLLKDGQNSGERTFVPQLSNTIAVTADAKGELTESNEGNNVASKSFACLSSDGSSGATSPKTNTPVANSMVGSEENIYALMMNALGVYIEEYKDG